MRVVDYVTQGFGGKYAPPVEIYFQNPIRFNPGPFNPGPSGFGIEYAPVETKIRLFLESERFPQYIVEAAIKTYQTRGVAGLVQTKNFGEALGPAFVAAEKFAYQQAERTGYANLGALYRNAITGTLNAAAVRTGTNPMINSLRTFYTSAASSIPNSSRDPERYLRNILRQSPGLGTYEMDRLIGIAQGGL